jgi:hypothetical protein
VTDASVHDSRKFDGLVNKANTSADVYADSAYRSAETEAKLKARGLRVPVAGGFSNRKRSGETGAARKLTPVKVSAAEPAYCFVRLLTCTAKANCTVVITSFDCDSARGQREQRVHDFHRYGQPDVG